MKEDIDCITVRNHFEITARNVLCDCTIDHVVTGTCAFGAMRKLDAETRGYRNA